jgi:DNA-binding response OmpR family regulator
MMKRYTSSASRLRRRILIVDDDDDARSVVGIYFQDAGYEVHVAADGNEAIAVALRTPPSVIILDLDMPGLDGWGTMTLLRAYATTAKIPVVAWTGCGPTAIRTVAAGFDVVMNKPCRPEELERAVDALLTTGCAERSDTA